MPFTVDDQPFGSLSVTLADNDATLAASIMATAPATLSLSVYGAAPGVPLGGTEGQILAKSSDADWATEWIDNYATELRIVARNETGSTLAKGTVVYINGASGNKPTLAKALATGDATSAQTLGMVSDDILNNQNGEVTVRGLLEGLDTSAFTAGTQLYLSGTTAGAVTSTKPSAPVHLVYVGIVSRQHVNQGQVEVAVQNGFELHELHDVKITSVSNGQVLKYDSAQGLWVNGTDVGGVAWGGITGTLSNQTDLQNALDAKATAADYLSKAGNLSGLANVTTARGNLSLGASDNVVFNTVSRTTGGTGIGDITRSYTVGINTTYGGNLTFTKYSYTGDGGDPEAPYLSDYKRSDLTAQGIEIKNVTLNTNGTEQDGFWFRIGGSVDSGIYVTRWTAGVSDAYVITPDQLLLTSAGNGSFIIEPQNGITFPDTTVQTTAYPGTSILDGYATESWVTSQGYLTSAPVTSVAGKTGAVTLAVGDVSGAAPTSSPALTGTPTAPTAAAATNTTQIATTAFVQQEVPAASTTAAGKVELATNAETIAGTSTTIVPSLSNIPAIVSHPELRSLGHISSSAVSGSGTVTAATIAFGLREMYLNTLAVGRARYAYYNVGVAGPPMSRADRTKLDFSKKIWIGGKCCLGVGGATSYLGDSNTMTRITLGGYTTDMTGDMTVRGIGFKKVGGVSSTISLTVHNGTALTDVSTTKACADGESIDWMIYSDGSGNVTLYINGVQVATTASGPTSATTAHQCAYREQVEATSTPGVRAIIQSTGGWLFIEG